MGKTVIVAARKVEVCTPIECGQYDPPMQEWLALTVSDDDCPYCASRHWGTRNPRGYFKVRTCHDEKNIGCKAKWRGPVTPYMINEIVGALNDEPRRFAMGPALS